MNCSWQLVRGPSLPPQMGTQWKLCSAKQHVQLTALHVMVFVASKLKPACRLQLKLPCCLPLSRLAHCIPQPNLSHPLPNLDHPPPHTHTPQVLLANVSAIDWALLPRAIMGLLALLCGNGYIVGINQIYDVDIDAVNKPFLPVAAGRLANRTAIDTVHHRRHRCSSIGLDLLPQSSCC